MGHILVHHSARAIAALLARPYPPANPTPLYIGLTCRGAARTSFTEELAELFRFFPRQAIGREFVDARDLPSPNHFCGLFFGKWAEHASPKSHVLSITQTAPRIQLNCLMC